jgi:hypothetical protein
MPSETPSFLSSVVVLDTSKVPYAVNFEVRAVQEERLDYLSFVEGNTILRNVEKS